MGVSDNFTGLIQRTSDSFIRDNIYMVDKSLLARAMKPLAPEHQEKLFRNMTNEMAADVKRLIANLGDLSAETIDAAQQEIISLASKVF